MAAREIDLGSVVGPTGKQGAVGPKGEQGTEGAPGKDATINGYNTVTLKAGRNVEMSQSGGEITIGETDDTPKLYDAGGVIMTNSTGTMHATGHVTVTVYRSGFARIDFTAKVTDNTGGNDFDWGLSRDLLHALPGNIPIITPMTGGNAIIFNSGGTLNSESVGYGLFFSPSSRSVYWVPDRVYTPEGNSGFWGSTLMPEGYSITGVAYGTVAGSAAATLQMQQEAARKATEAAQAKTTQENIKEDMQNEREHI